MKYFSALTALCLLCFSSISFADDADILREMQDRKDIEHLMWRYVRALDTLDAEAYAAVFTEDGTFGSGPMAAEGHEGLKALVEGVREGREEREANGAPPSPQMHHVIANSWLEFIDEDHARMHSYWMTVFGTTDASPAPNVAAVGRAIDELVRVDGNWLIQSRDVAPEE